MKVSYSTNAWGSVMGSCAAMNNVNGAYYYSTGEASEAIKGISAASFEGIEMFDGNLLEFEGREKELNNLLEANGVKLKAVYCAANFIYDEILDEELFRIKRAAEFAKKFGATEIPVGGGATRYDGIREGDYGKLASALDKLCDIAQDLGMVASFHPHMGSLVETPEQLDKVMQLSKINLCPDPGHVKLGGGEPIEIVKKYADRITYTHLKDVNASGMFCPLGLGVVDNAEIVKYLENCGHAVDYTVECDGWDKNPAEGAKITAQYLSNLF